MINYLYGEVISCDLNLSKMHCHFTLLHMLQHLSNEHWNLSYKLLTLLAVSTRALDWIGCILLGCEFKSSLDDFLVVTTGLLVVLL